MARDRIVAVGFLTAGDLERLGAGFDRALPIHDEKPFEGLLAQLDKIEVTPLGEGVALHRRFKAY